MDQQEGVKLGEMILAAWTSQDVDRVLSCYTEDCVYQDPNTRGPVVGHDALRRYLERLFQGWSMRWSLREFFPFAEEEGGALLWHAELTPTSGGKTTAIDGMDLAVVRGQKLCRNEVYFDRAALFSSR
jgi:ketosteroid isomerase-like protein